MKLVIKNVEDSIAAVNSGKTDPYQLLILVECIEDAYRMIKGCPQIKELSVGYTGDRPGCRRLTHWVFATQEEIDRLAELDGAGFPVTLQTVPTEKSVSVKKALS